MAQKPGANSDIQHSRSSGERRTDPTRGNAPNMRILPRSFLSTGGLGLVLLLAACGGGGAQLVVSPDDAGVGGQGGVGAADDSGPGRINISTPDSSMVSIGDAAASSDSLGIGLCGDGNLGADESCDDGNSVPGDGCSGVCTIEPGYVCAVPGKACVYTVTMVCGTARSKAPSRATTAT